MKPAYEANQPRKNTGPTRLGEVIPQLMARRGYARLISFEQFAEAWEQASGPLSEQSRAGRLRGGVLEIFVRNSVVVQELTFKKRQLLKSLEQHLPDQKIRDLRITVGSWD